MMRPLGRIFMFLVFFTLLSCEVKRPDDVMSPDKMEAFLYDYHLVQSMTVQYSSDDYKEKLYYNYIFKKHGIDEQQFESSMQWYNRYPKHLQRIYANLEARLDAEVERLSAENNLLEEGISLEALSPAADSLDLWTGSRFKYLSSTPLNSRLAFSFKVPEDTMFVNNDSLSFSFMASFLPDGARDVEQSAYASLRLEYADGNVFTHKLDFDTTAVYHLQAPRYADSKLKKMSGFVYYTDKDTMSRSALLLGDISVVVVHPPKK